MIMTRAPLRASFVGGGSDLASFYHQKPGQVISTSLNKYVYICLKERFNSGFRISYSKTENCDYVYQIEHNLVRECLHYFQIEKGLEIISMADVPGNGTGLGSSSAFTVALIKALAIYTKSPLTEIEIAEIACDIEIKKCCQPIGKQDQYAASIGGLQKYTFHSNEVVDISPITLSVESLDFISQHILLLYTGATRSASDILREQSAQLATQANSLSKMDQMVNLVDPFLDALITCNIKLLAQLLDQNWRLKVQVSPSISNGWINAAYEKALGAGAYGGKVLGAGAGGFFLFLADINDHSRIADTLQMPILPVRFEDLGCVQLV
jgi:D-glycero-alpha-D-manno-heptose-7-phosphate kinase